MTAIYLGQILVGMSFLHTATDSVAPSAYPTEVIVVQGSSPDIDPVNSRRACLVGMEVIGVGDSDEQLTVVVTNDDGRHVIHEMPAHVLRQRFSRAPWHYEPAEIIKMIEAIPRDQQHRFGDQGISANTTVRVKGSVMDKSILDRLVWHLKQCLPNTQFAIQVIHADGRTAVGIRWHESATADDVILHLRNHGLISIFIDNNMDILVHRQLSKPNFDKACTVVQSKVGSDVPLPTLDEFAGGSSGYPPEVVSLLSETCLNLDIGLTGKPSLPVPPGQTKES